jgi:mannose-6-phosphate isomerase-like protein (cupin superfamily)
MLSKISLPEKLSRFSDHWTPKIIGELNGQHVKLVKFAGEFVWHKHDAEDELFLVVKGEMRMDYRDAAGLELRMVLGEGEMVVVPRGVEHRPSAESECSVLLFEPAGTLNTGDAGSSKLTVADPERI